MRAYKVGTQHVIEPDDLVEVTGSDRHRAGEAQAAYSSDQPARTGSQTQNEWLPAIVGRVVRTADPIRIVLFGARAHGVAGDDSDYELLVIVDDAPDRVAATVEIRRSFADIPVSAEILVASAADVIAGPTGSSGRALAEGRIVYARDAVTAGPILQHLFETGRATPALNPDTSVLPARWPSKGGITATDALLAERREDLR